MVSSLYTLLAWASLAVTSTAVAAFGVSASTEVLAAEVVDGETDYQRPPPYTNHARVDIDDWQEAAFDVSGTTDHHAAIELADHRRASRSATTAAAPVATSAALRSLLLHVAPKTSPPVRARS